MDYLLPCPPLSVPATDVPCFPVHRASLPSFPPDSRIGILHVERRLESPSTHFVYTIAILFLKRVEKFGIPLTFFLVPTKVLIWLLPSLSGLSEDFGN